MTTLPRTISSPAAKIAHTLLAACVLLSLEGATLAACVGMSSTAHPVGPQEDAPRHEMMGAHSCGHSPVAVVPACHSGTQSAACAGHQRCCEVHESLPTRRSPAADPSTASAGSARVPAPLPCAALPRHAAWAVAGVRFVKPVSDRKTDLRI